MKYPKIHSLWKRDQKTHNVIPGEYAREEFKNIKRWQITEKVDGMNIRIHWDRTLGPLFYGRTDKAQIPSELFQHITETFTHKKFEQIFDDDVDQVWIFGEGYGPNIQNGGAYRPNQGVILFDIVVEGIWLERHSVHDIADKFGVTGVPELLVELPDDLTEEQFLTETQIIEYVKQKYPSTIAVAKKEMEGIVARPCPLMLYKDGTPIMFKLKARDFND